MKESILIILGKAVCILVALWLVLAAPAGWLYDLWAGKGTEQGQRPGESVQTLRRQEEIETFFLEGTPATVSGGELTACPLARLRDGSQEGIHHKNSPGGGSVYLSEYITADYPLSPWEKLIQKAVGGFYNRYYLTELEDDSHLCVYFDDYLTLTGRDSYPTGYLRYTTTEERRMLSRMAEDYGVDPVYVLDMYRHGKVNWMLDLLLRMGVVLAAVLLMAALQDLWRKRDRKEI